ncbi:hypothetical protein E5D57_005107 [Metarhizium anisopliae]|nr:hypothetical protein E5D57_005107 [Metarhizium anisopliae]
MSPVVGRAISTRGQYGHTTWGDRDDASKWTRRDTGSADGDGVIVPQLRNRNAKCADGVGIDGVVTCMYLNAFDAADEHQEWMPRSLELWRRTSRGGGK